jgi:hypothetical protein
MPVDSSITAKDETNLTEARRPQGFQLHIYADQALEFLVAKT